VLLDDGQSAVGGAKSGALADSFTRSDPGLQRLIAAWPTLPEPIRRAVLALIETALQVASGTP
jgi:hypothetical protein